MRMRQVVGLLVLALSGCTGPDVWSPPPDPGPQPPPVLGPAWGKQVSGGTMAVSRDGSFAVLADPDRDRIVTIDLSTHRTIATIPLAKGDEPGRVVEDGAGRFHVALRRGGAIVTLENGAGRVLARRGVCAEPRGLAWEPKGDLVHVACAGGELLSLPAAGGPAVRQLRLDRDLRDVVVVGDVLMITRYKSAEVLTVDAQGAITRRDRSPDVTRRAFVPTTGELLEAPSQAEAAWRAVPLPDGKGIVVAHQRARRSLLDTEPGGYGGGMCGGGPIEPGATLFAPSGETIAGHSLSFTALPVDVAVSPDGQRLAFALAGDQTVRTASTRMLTNGDKDPCEDPPEENVIFESQGIPTSVAFLPTGELVVYYADHNLVDIYALPYTGGPLFSIAIPGERGYDMGRAIFYSMTQNELACASCHIDGGADGLVWEFRQLGPRRTQNVFGHILARAPYHWDGDMTDLSRLMNEVFTGRMGGKPLGEWEVRALGQWLDSIPAPVPAMPEDPLAVERGSTLFHSPEVGCSSCHQGALFTSNLRFDVGTGGAFKVPSLLGVGARAPFLHNGCAATLRDRFTCGGGDQHGVTSGLSEAQIGDLVAFLESL